MPGNPKRNKGGNRTVYGRAGAKVEGCGREQNPVRTRSRKHGKGQKEKGTKMSDTIQKSDSAIHLQEIERVDDPNFLLYLDLYETAFPANERIAVSSLVKTLLKRQSGEATTSHLLTAIDDAGEMAAMAHYDEEAECGAAYLIYIAVAEKRRGGGIGSQTFQALIERARGAGYAALLFEVDSPDNHTGPEREVAERRIRFYRHLGAKRLSGIHYLQSVEFYPEGVPMHIMVCPLTEVTAEQAFTTARCLFGEALSRTEEPLTLE